MIYKVVIIKLFFLYSILNAQSFEYKNNILKIDGKEVAKIVTTKNYMGFANDFEVFDMNDTKIIQASYAADYEEDPYNNMDFYYTINFITTSQTGIFYLSKLSTEKSLANLLGKNKIFVDGEVNATNITSLIDKKGLNPKKIIDYSVVNRNTSWPIEIKSGGTVEQDGKTIGSFKDVSIDKSTDIYEFYLPKNILVAKIWFTNGNNSQECDLHTSKDNLKRKIATATNDKTEIYITSGDRNELMIKRVLKWLIANGYM